MRFLGTPLKIGKRAQQPNSIPDVRRPLSEKERALLSFLLTHTTPEAARFLEQIDETTVEGTCSCGCPTVWLVGPDREEEVWSGPDPLVDVYGKTSDGRLVGVLVFATRRQLSGLEVYNLSESEEPWGLPTTDSLETREGVKLLKVGIDA